MRFSAVYPCMQVSLERKLLAIGCDMERGECERVLTFRRQIQTFHHQDIFAAAFDACIERLLKTEDKGIQVAQMENTGNALLI